MECGAEMGDLWQMEYGGSSCGRWSIGGVVVADGVWGE